MWPLLRTHLSYQYHIETSLLIWSANQWTGFYMISGSVVIESSKFFCCCPEFSTTIFFLISERNNFNGLQFHVLVRCENENIETYIVLNFCRNSWKMLLVLVLSSPKEMCNWICITSNCKTNVVSLVDKWPKTYDFS